MSFRIIDQLGTWGIQTDAGKLKKADAQERRQQI